MSELPKGWVLATLNQVGEIITGNTPSTSNSENYGGTIPFIKPPMLKNNLIRNSQEKITEQGSHNARILPPETVLVSCIGNLGKVAITAVPSATNQQINAVVFGKGILPYYGFYYCQTLEKWLIAESSATTIAIINKTKFGNAPILVPPLNEQNRIVAKLEELFSDLDAGVNELKTAQAKLVQYRQSLLKAAVEGELSCKWRESRPVDDTDETGAQLLERILIERRQRWEEKQLARFAEQGKQPPKDWQKKYPEPVQPDTSNLPDLPEGWVWASLDMILEDINSGKSFKCEERPPLADEVGVIKVSAVSWGEYREFESKTCVDESNINSNYFVMQDDFLFSRANTVELIGACVIAKNVNLKNMLSDKILRFEFVDFSLKQWVLYFLRSVFGREQIEFFASGNQESMKNISQEKIKKIVLPLPPINELEFLSKAIVEAQESISELQGYIKANLIKGAAQRKNILRAAFAGELVAQDPNDEPANMLLARIQAERQAQPKAKKTRPSRSKQELHVMPKTVLEALQEANDWLTGQELAKQYGIGDGASINTVEAFYAELRELELNNKLEVKPDSFGFKRQDKIRLKDKSDAA